MIKFLSKKSVRNYGAVALLSLVTLNEARAQYNWSPAGPVFTAGRIRNMIVDKADGSGNTLYVGSTSSGIFKSTDAGANWFALDDQGAVRNISYMAQSLNNTIYAATGEGFLRPSQKAKALRGTGLYKLVNGVLVLVADSTITGAYINKIACHPSDANQIALATNKGILVSTDGGASFSAANSVTANATIGGLDVKFGSNGILFCTVGKINSGGDTSSLWRANGSNIGTATFVNKTPWSNAVVNKNYGRIEIGISPSSPAVIYASCSAKYTTNANATPTLAGLFYSSNNGDSWGTVVVGSSQLDPLSNGGTRASGDFAHNLVVDASNSNILYFCGYKLMRFTITSFNGLDPIGVWERIPANAGFGLPQWYIHENIHDFKVVGSKYYAITDAGIFRSVDGMFTWQPFYKGLVTGQFNSVSIERYPLYSGGTNQTPALTPKIGFIGGTAGNGMVYFRGEESGGNITLNTEVGTLSGDIFNTEYSKLLPSAAYIAPNNGVLYRTTDVASGDATSVDMVSGASKQTVLDFVNNTYSITGTPFKLWEYYGQVYKGTKLKNPDNLIFYNDTSISLAAIQSLTSTTNFSFTIGRPQRKAAIDHIDIKAMMVTVAATPSVITISNFTVVNTKTLSIQMNTFVVPNSGTLAASINTVTGYVGTYSLNKVILNSNTQLDEIQCAIAAPLYSTQPVSTVTNMETYVRMRATVYYRYYAGDSLSILYDNISTLGKTYSVVAQAPMVWTQPPTSTLNVTSNAVQKFDLEQSARLAVPLVNSIQTVKGIYVTRAPLDMNTPLSFVKVSGNGALTTNSLGVPLSGYANTIAITGTPSIIEWGKSGQELYYTTEESNQYKLYRVSYITDILDSTARSYSGKLQSGMFTYSNTAAPPTYTTTQFSNPNPNSPYRTTLIGTFGNKKITSINVSSTDSVLMLTFNDPTGFDTLVMVSTGSIRYSDFNNINFVNRTSVSMTTNSLQTYCALLEKDQFKEAYIGTDKGLYYNSDILGATTWTLANNNQLPRVQVFDIRQQTMTTPECYNSKQIYVATNGRGIWINKDYYQQTVIGVEEIVKSAYANNLKLYPNPTNGAVKMEFRGYDNETVSIQVMDINGRTVMSDNIGKIYNTDVNYTFDTASLPTGVYIVNVSSDSGIRRVTKLIVTK
jgi:hypothetical protein